MPNTVAVQITAQGPGADDLAKAEAGGKLIATAAAKGTTQVQASVQQLGNTLTTGLSPLQKFAQGLERMDAREATRGMFALRTGLQGLASEAIGAGGSIAKLGESFLAFGVGGPAGLALLGGVGLVGLMAKGWDEVTAHAREAQEAQDKAIAHLAEIRAGAITRGRGGPEAVDTRAARAALAETERQIMHERLVIAHPEAVRDAAGGATGFAELQGARERLADLEQKAADLRRELNAVSFNKVGEEGAKAATQAKDAMKHLAEQVAGVDAALAALGRDRAIDNDAIAAENVARAFAIGKLEAQGLSAAQAEAVVNTNALTKALEEEAKALETIAKFGPEVTRSHTVTLIPIAPAAPKVRVPEAQPEPKEGQGGGTGGFSDLANAMNAATEATQRFAVTLTRDVGNVLIQFSKGPTAAKALAAGSSILGAFAERRFTKDDQDADPTHIAGTLKNPGLALPATVLSIGAGLLDGFKSLFSSSQQVITIGGYTPAALAQLRELSGSGTLVAINQGGGAVDLATLQYQLNRRSRQDAIPRLPVTHPGPGNS